ncbi:MAG: ADP-ribosyltransferase-containing protein [Candidatus Thorarchaeota archaeon]
MLDVYVKLNNPAVIGRGRSYVDMIPESMYEDSLDEAAEEIAEEYGVSVEEAKDDYSYDVVQRAMDIEGVENPLVDALQESINDNTYDDGESYNAGEILADFVYDQEVDLNNLEKEIRESVSFAENVEGEITSSQIVSDMFKNLGYDGIIVNNPSQRFRGMNLGDQTSHIHVFDEYANQIKLADGTNADFGTSKDIRFQKDPENASKVVDENGEPLVMYHGTKNEFNVFSNVMAGSNTTRNLQRNQWFWFADNKDIAESYGSARILPVFLNVRNPEIAEKSLTKTYEKASKKSLKDGIIGEDLPDTRYETRTILVDGSSWWVDRKGMSGSVAEEIERKTETDELIFLLDDTLSYWKDELESMQIDVDKLSKLKGQEFDDAIEAIDPYYHDPIMAAKAIKVLEKGGVEALRITDPLKGIIVAAKESNQIKLADGTNRTFDPTSKDIRFQKFDERTSREGARRPVRGVAPSKATR